jgi:phosphate:Na+ symporter
MPFGRALEKLAMLTIRDKVSETPSYEFLDERLLNTPSFAISHCYDMAAKMCELARQSSMCAFALLYKYDAREVALLGEDEMQLDTYEDKLGTFLVKLSAKELSDNDSWEISRLLHAIGDLERLGDHALNLCEAAQELHDKPIIFSEPAMEDLAILRSALEEVLNTTTRAFVKRDKALAKLVEPLEQVIDGLVQQMRARHILRLQRGECGIEAGFVWSDLMIGLERMSDHCSNLAVCLIQSGSRTMEGHRYLNVTRSEDNLEFVEEFDRFSEKYKLD